MALTLTKTIDITAGQDKVWEYVNDLSRWPEWAIHNVQSATKGSDDYWLMTGPRGVSKVKMYSDKLLGLLDHEFIDPGEGKWDVPCRVVSSGANAHFMITFTWPEQMPEEAFAAGMKLLDEELEVLKSILERQ